MNARQRDLLDRALTVLSQAQEVIIKELEDDYKSRNLTSYLIMVRCRIQEALQNVVYESYDTESGLITEYDSEDEFLEALRDEVELKEDEYFDDYLDSEFDDFEYSHGSVSASEIIRELTYHYDEIRSEWLDNLVDDAVAEAETLDNGYIGESKVFRIIKSQ